ncbi:MAG: hypothetical protein SW833_03275 [Cyanobacteriota bacterium]|nr:hypothetical protein [Cyanobacteriota bacterium]
MGAIAFNNRKAREVGFCGFAVTLFRRDAGGGLRGFAEAGWVSIEDSVSVGLQLHFYVKMRMLVCEDLLKRDGVDCGWLSGE